MNKRQVATLGFLALVQGMIFLDNAIINIALPNIQETLHMSTNYLQWVISAYTLSFGGFLLLGGRIADLFGRKRVLLIGLAVFIVSSLCIGLSTTSPQIILFRCIQGLAAGFMSPAALSLLLTLFHNDQRVKALATWSAVGSAGAALGLSLGGIITQHFGWPWIFLLNIPLGAMAFWGIHTLVPSQKPAQLHKPDWLGALYITGCLVAFVFALTQAAERGWSHYLTLLSGTIGALLAVSFIYRQKHTLHPLVPLHIFRNRNLVASNLAMVGIAASLYGMLFFASLYVQNILQYSPSMSGLSFLLFPALVVISSSFAPFILQRVGVKVLLLGGISLVVIGTYSMTLITEHGSFFTTIFPGLSCMAIGLGATYLAINTAATQNIAKHLSGLASGVIITSQQIGSAIGLAVLTGLSASVAAAALNSGVETSTALVSSYKAAFWGTTCCALFAFGVSWLVHFRHPVARAQVLAEEKI